MTISVADFCLNNIITLNLLLGLIIIIYANRRQKIPATSVVIWLIITLIVIIIAEYFDKRAASLSHPAVSGMIVSAVWYILRPLLILWEVYLLTPERKRRIVYTIPEVVNTIIMLAAFVQPGRWVFGYDDNNIFWREPLGFSPYIVSFLYLVLIIYQSFRYFKIAENRKMSMPVLYMVLSTFLICTLEYMDILVGYVDEIIASNFLFYYIYLCSVYQEKIKEMLLIREQELSKNRLMLMQNQIRPHFIYNSLTTIQSLCSDKEAIKAISEFSGFLRGSVDMLTETECIPVYRELNTVKNYLALVKRRFGDKLQTDIDIEDENFVLPAFSIQILVENAVEHGIRKKPDGKGTLWVHVYTDSDMHIVDVTDDGIGYDMSKVPDAQENHVGLMNLNERLNIMCNGTLEILSCPGIGTMVIIKIPVK